MSQTNTTRVSFSLDCFCNQFISRAQKWQRPTNSVLCSFLPVEKQGADSSLSSSCSWLYTRLLDSRSGFLLEEPNILAGKSHILTSSDDPCYPLVIVVTYNRFNSLFYVL